MALTMAVLFAAKINQKSPLADYLENYELWERLLSQIQTPMQVPDQQVSKQYSNDGIIYYTYIRWQTCTTSFLHFNLPVNLEACPSNNSYNVKLRFVFPLASYVKHHDTGGILGNSLRWSVV